MPNIDPMRTANSDKIYAELGAQTLDRIARNHNGSDGSANRAKLAREYYERPTASWLKGEIKEEDEDDDDKKGKASK